MSEAKWDASRKPVGLLRKVRRTASGRKLQLYHCGVCRIIWPFIPNDQLRQGVEALELLLDDLLDGSEYLQRMELAKTVAFQEMGVVTVDYTPGDFAMYVVQAALSYDAERMSDSILEWGRAASRLSVGVDNRLSVDQHFDRAVCELLRDLFPPLGRGYERQRDGSVLLPSGEFFTPSATAVAIAQGVVHDQAFDRLPILADALEDANLCDRRWLDHLRFGARHWRGCWAVDAVLGK